MENAALAVDAQQAKTSALLRLKKARTNRDTTQTMLQQKQSENIVTNRYGVGYDVAADAQISGLKEQLAKNESEVSAAQSACNSVACETVVISKDVVTTESSDGTISYNDDSLPVWVYILIALFVIGLVVGIVWFVIRDRSNNVSLFSLPSPLLTPPPQALATVDDNYRPVQPFMPIMAPAEPLNASVNAEPSNLSVQPNVSVTASVAPQSVLAGHPTAPVTLSSTSTGTLNVAEPTTESTTATATQTTQVTAKVPGQEENKMPATIASLKENLSTTPTKAPVITLPEKTPLL